MQLGEPRRRIGGDHRLGLFHGVIGRQVLPRVRAQVVAAEDDARCVAAGALGRLGDEAAKVVGRHAGIAAILVDLVAGRLDQGRVPEVAGEAERRLDDHGMGGTDRGDTLRPACVERRGNVEQRVLHDAVPRAWAIAACKVARSLVPSMGPRRPTASAPAIAACSSASRGGVARSQRAVKVAPKQSPAPVGSTSSTAKAGWKMSRFAVEVAGPGAALFPDDGRNTGLQQFTDRTVCAAGCGQHGQFLAARQEEVGACEHLPHRLVHAGRREHFLAQVGIERDGPAPRPDGICGVQVQRHQFGRRQRRAHDVQVVHLVQHLGDGARSLDPSAGAVREIEDEVARPVGAIAHEGRAGGAVGIDADRRDVDAVAPEAVEVQLAEVVRPHGRDDRARLAEPRRLVGEDRRRARGERACQRERFEEPGARAVGHDFGKDLADHEDLLYLRLRHWQPPASRRPRSHPRPCGRDAR